MSRMTKNYLRIKKSICLDFQWWKGQLMAKERSVYFSQNYSFFERLRLPFPTISTCFTVSYFNHQ